MASPARSTRRAADDRGLLWRDTVFADGREKRARRLRRSLPARRTRPARDAHTRGAQDGRSRCTADRARVRVRGRWRGGLAKPRGLARGERGRRRERTGSSARAHVERAGSGLRPRGNDDGRRPERWDADVANRALAEGRGAIGRVRARRCGRGAIPRGSARSRAELLVADAPCGARGGSHPGRVRGPRPRAPGRDERSRAPA